MNLPDVFQNLVLSGVLGYVSLSIAQNNGAVSGCLSAVDANLHRLIFCFIDYVLFWIIHYALQLYFGDKSVVFIASVLITASVTICYTYVFICWRRHHMTNKAHFTNLTVREQAFHN